MKLLQWFSQLFKGKQREDTPSGTRQAIEDPIRLVKPSSDRSSNADKVLQKRQYHLGLDWGTSSTKLVLRDYSRNNAFVLYLDKNHKSYRYPSTIVRQNDCIYFGHEAEAKRNNAQKVWDALKADLCHSALAEQTDNSVSEKEDIATLYLAHIISRAFDIAEDHAARANEKAIMGMTLGIPAEELEQTALRTTYLNVVRTAYALATEKCYDPQGRKLSECKNVLNAVSENLALKAKNKSPDGAAYASWLRPELAAAMYWAIKSPKIQDDLYSCVDIGAWTTNASYFRIHHADSNAKGISFFGGSCSQPGMIKLLDAIAHDINPNSNYLSIIDNEEKHLRQAKHNAAIDDFGEECFAVWDKGFRSAYAKEKKQSSWDGKLNVMVVGGGSKVERIRQKFYKRFPHEGWQPPKAVPDLGIPNDLYELPAKGVLPEKRFSGDHTFLLVAYGLSVHSMDFPKTTLSPQVAPYQPKERSKFKPYDECGYDK